MNKQLQLLRIRIDYEQFKLDQKRKLRLARVDFEELERQHLETKLRRVTEKIKRLEDKHEDEDSKDVNFKIGSSQMTMSKTKFWNFLATLAEVLHEELLPGQALPPSDYLSDGVFQEKEEESTVSEVDVPTIEHADLPLESKTEEEYPEAMEDDLDSTALRFLEEQEKLDVRVGTPKKQAKRKPKTQASMTSEQKLKEEAIEDNIESSSPRQSGRKRKTSDKEKESTPAKVKRSRRKTATPTESDNRKLSQSRAKKPKAEDLEEALESTPVKATTGARKSTAKRKQQVKEPPIDPAEVSEENPKKRRTRSTRKSALVKDKILVSEEVAIALPEPEVVEEKPKKRRTKSEKGNLVNEDPSPALTILPTKETRKQTMGSDEAEDKQASRRSSRASTVISTKSTPPRQKPQRKSKKVAEQKTRTGASSSSLFASFVDHDKYSLPKLRKKK